MHCGRERKMAWLLWKQFSNSLKSWICTYHMTQQCLISRYFSIRNENTYLSRDKYMNVYGSNICSCTKLKTNAHQQIYGSPYNRILLSNLKGMNYWYVQEHRDKPQSNEVQWKKPVLDTHCMIPDKILQNTNLLRGSAVAWTLRRDYQVHEKRWGNESVHYLDCGNGFKVSTSVKTYHNVYFKYVYVYPNMSV
jgi:hypothetical protein